MHRRLRLGGHLIEGALRLHVDAAVDCLTLARFATAKRKLIGHLDGCASPLAQRVGVALLASSRFDLAHAIAEPLLALVRNGLLRTHGARKSSVVVQPPCLASARPLRPAARPRGTYYPASVMAVSTSPARVAARTHATSSSHRQHMHPRLVGDRAALGICRPAWATVCQSSARTPPKTQ